MNNVRYKFISSGQQPDDALVVSQTLLGSSLKPLAPVHLRGSRNPAGDLLIEWTRRERLPLPLRDYAGTPISEEDEIYIVEIYSGSTLKWTERVKLSLARPIKWTEVESPGAVGSAAFGTDATVTCTDQAGGDGFPRPTADWDFSFTVNGASPDMGMGRVDVPDAFDQQSSGVTQTAYLMNTNGTVAVANENPGVTVSVSNGDRLSIVKSGEGVVFYKNRHLGMAPFYFSVYPTAGRLFKPVFAQFFGGTYIASACTLSMGRTSYLYSAPLQVSHFGSTQSSIKVRVMQESAIVGRGYYLESNI